MSTLNDALLIISWMTSEFMMSCSKTVSRSSEAATMNARTYLVRIWLVAIFVDFKVWLKPGNAAGFEELAQMAHICRALFKPACDVPWQR
jgi:hypothetical protein